MHKFNLDISMADRCLTWVPIVGVDPPAAPAPAAGEGGNNPAAGDAPTSFIGPLLPFLMLFALMYFLFLRPQQNEQRRRQEMLKALKKNDRIVTSGGIIGTISQINADSNEVTVRIGDNSHVKIARWAIQGLWTDGKDGAETAGAGSEKK